MATIRRPSRRWIDRPRHRRRPPRRDLRRRLRRQRRSTRSISQPAGRPAHAPRAGGPHEPSGSPNAQRGGGRSPRATTMADSRAAPSSRPKRSRRRGGATTRGVWSTGARAPKHLGPVMVSRLVGRPRAARRGRGPVRGARQEPLIVFWVGFQVEGPAARPVGRDRRRPSLRRGRTTAELVSVMLFHRVDTAGHTSHLRRMQSPTDPSDRADTIGVEAFDAAYGAGFQTADDSPHAVECELVEDGGAFVAHRPTAADGPRRVAFVDGTLRTEARLTSTGADGDVSMGLAGSWAAGAVLVDGDEPARFDQVTTGRAAISRPAGPSGFPTTATAGAGSRTRSTGPMSTRRVSSRGRVGGAGGWLAARLRLGSAPGRTGPGEPDADRGPRTASAPAAGRRTPRLAYRFRSPPRALLAGRTRPGDSRVAPAARATARAPARRTLPGPLRPPRSIQPPHAESHAVLPAGPVTDFPAAPPP